MTKPVSVQQDIRLLDAKGVPWREIARRLGVSRETVKKYAQMEDCSPRPASRPARVSGIDAYAQTVDAWLGADLRMPRKQRHTARRVYDRLVAEHGFEGSYSMVQRYVKRWREERRDEGDGFMELEWRPGTMQVDFGQAQATLAGREVTVHCLVATFPHSNMRYVAAMPGENAECVCEGLLEIFEHIGLVPSLLVFDNATGAAHRVAWDKVSVVRVFQLFCEHHRVEARFCNPRSGWEKGSVENAVGFVRRNLMVPVPSAEGYQALTRAWFDACERLAQADHYRLGVPVAGLFESEKEHMLPLPSAAFDPVEWRSVKADRTGTVLIDSNRYLAGPKWHSMRLQAGVRVFQIELRDPDGGRITTLERVWGRSPDTQADPAALLAVIARKPRSWGESPIRGDFPGPVRDLPGRMDAPERSSLISDIRHASETYGFPAAAGAVAAIIKAGRTVGRATIETTAARILQGDDTPGGQDLTRYDKYMEER